MGTVGSRRRNRARRLREKKQKKVNKPHANNARGCLIPIIFFCFVIVIGAHVTYENTNRAVELEMNGVKTQALIVNVEHAHQSGEYYTYKFNVEGTTYINTEPEYYERYKLGQTIEIMYSRDDPTISDTINHHTIIKKTKYFKRKYAKKLGLQRK